MGKRVLLISAILLWLPILLAPSLLGLGQPAGSVADHDSRFGVSSAHASGSRILIEGADAVWEKGFIASESLKDVANEVPARILAEYADSIFSQELVKPEQLSQQAANVSPRILVEHADSILSLDLEQPSEIVPVPAPTPIPTTESTAVLNPTTGNVGTEITVGGTGFKADGTVTIKYDATQVATVAVEGNGSFTATFTAPASKSGNHTVTVSDGTNTKQCIFIMESTAPPVPGPLKPEMGIKAETQTYFDWNDVTDPSGVTYSLQVAKDKNFSSIVLAKEGLTRSEYALTETEKIEPTKKDTPYYWRIRAIDGASNEGEWSAPRRFYVGSTPGITTYVLFALSALLIGFLFLFLGRRNKRTRLAIEEQKREIITMIDEALEQKR